MTVNKTVLMGKNTYLSLPRRFRPLPNRTNIVISTNESLEEFENLNWYKSIDSAIDSLSKLTEEIVIIGGAKIYKQTMDIVDEIYATEVLVEIEGDVFYPEIIKNEWSSEMIQSFKKNETNDFDFNIVKYTRLN